MEIENINIAPASFTSNRFYATVEMFLKDGQLMSFQQGRGNKTADLSDGIESAIKRIMLEIWGEACSPSLVYLHPDLVKALGLESKEFAYKIDYNDTMTRDRIKSVGGKWDKESKVWRVTAWANPMPFAQQA